jgi:signal transduction histidine kinase
LLRRLTLVQRILAAFAVTTVLFLTSTLYSSAVLQTLGESAELQTRISEANQTAHELDREVLRSIILLAEYTQRGDTGAIGGLRRLRSTTRALSHELRTQTTSPTVRPELASFDALSAPRFAIADSIIAAVTSGATPAQVDLMRARREALDAQARQHLRVIVAAEQNALTQAIAADNRVRESAQARVTVVWAINFVLVLLISVLIPGAIRRKLGLLTDMTKRISRGDYSARVPVAGKDELDRLTENFNAMAAQLDELDKVKSEFVALASHQLRTPATGVKANLGMLVEGYCGELNDEQLEVLADAYASNERELAVIDDMLAVARVEAGQLVIHRTSTDLGELLRSVLAEQRSVISARSQTVSLQLPPQPIIIAADPDRLRMVFENLVSNASKYSFTGSSIAVIVEREARTVRVRVSDSGVGIDEKDLHKLYKKFSRIDNPLSRSVSGTGLGLYLAYEIVRLHGGVITAESAPGQGTTFLVRLPVEETA